MSSSSYDTFVSTNWWKGRDYILRLLSRQSRSPVNRCPERYLVSRTINSVRCRKLKWRCAGKWKYNLSIVDVRLLGTADTRGTRLPPPGSASGTDSEWHDGSLSWHVSPRHSQRHCARHRVNCSQGAPRGSHHKDGAECRRGLEWPRKWNALEIASMRLDRCSVVSHPLPFPLRAVPPTLSPPSHPPPHPFIFWVVCDLPGSDAIRTSDICFLQDLPSAVIWILQREYGRVVFDLYSWVRSRVWVVLLIHPACY